MYTHRDVPPRPLNTDLTAITALGLLAERPRHPYEMQRLIRYRDKTYVKGLPRSLYHAIDRLAKDPALRDDPLTDEPFGLPLLEHELGRGSG